MKLVITGTPGTGKTTIAREIATANNWPLVEANAVAKKGKCFVGREEVDLKKLAAAMKRTLSGKKSFVAEGHLLCEVALPCEQCVVLRCNPLLLEKRLKKRGYAKAKVGENALAEALDYCLTMAESNYGNVVQIDCTKKVPFRKVLAMAGKRCSDKVDWSRLLSSKTLEKYWKAGMAAKPPSKGL